MPKRQQYRLLYLIARAWFYAGHGGIRPLMRKVAGYVRRYRRHAKLLRKALPLERIPQLPPPVLLALDHLYGGGANAYLRQRMDQWPGTVALWQHVPDSGHHLLTVRAGGQESLYRGRGLSALERWLERQDVDCLLVNNLAGWSELGALCSFLAGFGAGQREVFLHDYLPLCPSYQLLNRDMVYCRVPSDTGLCAACLPRNRNAVRTGCKDIAAWREPWRRLLSAAHKLAAPDPSVAELYYRAFPELTDKIAIEPHPPLSPDWQPINAPKSPLHIGVVGNITYSKGAGLVREIVRLLPSLNMDCRLTVIGEIEAAIHAPGFTVTGRYEHDDLPRLLENLGVNICLIPSICPETFCYAAQEIIQLGLPLVCLDMGAQGGKARKYARGFLAPTPDASGCLSAIASACNQGPDNGKHLRQ